MTTLCYFFSLFIIILVLSEARRSFEAYTKGSSDAVKEHCNFPIPTANVTSREEVSYVFPFWQKSIEFKLKNVFQVLINSMHQVRWSDFHVNVEK